MRAVSDDTRYGFAIGRVRALETRLLDRQQYDRLVRARDAAEFRSLLADTDYLRAAGAETRTPEPQRPGTGPGGDGQDAELAGLFAAARNRNFAFFTRYCRDEWVLDIFRVRADAHNLKLAAKSALAGMPDADSGRLDFGRWDRDRISALVEARARTKPERYRAAIAEARARWETGPDPGLLDAVIDRAAAAETAEMARDNRFLAGYFARAADIQNLRALVRLKLLGEDRAGLEAVLLPGGTLGPDRFLRLLSEDWDRIAAAFRVGEYGRLMEQGIAGVTGGASGPGSRAEGAEKGRENSLPSGGTPARSAGSLLRFERLGRELELAWLARARYLTFGFEPLVSYYLFRENEVFNLQRLAVAKAAGMSEADCAELVAYA